MDIVNFFQQQVDKWNTENKCGLCWDFSAPLIESATNIVQPTAGKECCVKVMLLRQNVTAFSTTNNYDTTTQLLRTQSCNTSFQLLVLFDSKLGLNMYNEIKGHPTSESVWETKLSIIEECMKCDANLDFCEFLGTPYKITQWSGQQVINFQNSNYVGYRISVTFQKNN